MMRFLEKLAGYLFPAFLVSIAIFLAWKNYTPGTFLVGWDSLHPEFNFPLAIERVFSGAWREEQGIGAISAHAHMADLPRIVFLWFSSLALPISFLRYFYIFLCLIIGPLGVYVFTKHAFKEANRNSFFALSAAFLGGLYYLLNLGTLQHFFVPFEMFTTAYAFTPWLFYFGVMVLEESKKRNWIFFSLVVLLSSPMAYASTLFYATIFGLMLFLMVFSLVNREKTKLIKTTLGIGLTIVLLNAYWILPNLYSLSNQSKIIEQAKINQLFSPEAFLRNKNFGDYKDLLIQKNFLFSWRSFDFDKNTYVDLMDNWNIHLENQFVIWLGYVFAGAFIIGAAVAILRRDKLGLALFPATVFTWFFLLNTNGPSGSLYSYLYKHIGLFREALRLPFTKFSILYMFVSSFYFTYFFQTLLTLRAKPFKAVVDIVKFVLVLEVLVGLIYFMKPAFEGNFISPLVRNNIPKEYFDLFDWFKNNPQGRVATFPAHTIWGWEYHNWKYEGSGILSFGIENPMLVRDYDRWSPYNESFYNEIAFALYANDREAVLKILEKYRVKYLLLDESVVNAGGSADLLLVKETKEMLSELSINKVANFGFLTIYKTGFEGTEGFISSPESFTKVDLDLDYSQVDQIYSKYNNYIQNKGSTGYPFINFDKRGDVEIKIADKIEFVNKRNGAKVTYPKNNGITENLSINRGFSEGYNCDLEKTGKVWKKILGKSVFYRAEADGVSCDYLNYPELPYKEAYILRIKGQNKEGRGLKIYLFNYKTKRMELEELLPTGNFDEVYMIYPKNIEGQGYSLNFETRSFGRVASENIIEAIELYPVNFNFLTSVYIGNPEPEKVENHLNIENIRKFGTWLYKVQTSGRGLLVLDQGYEPGWIAIPAFNFQPFEHVKINSWENGFIVNNTKTVFIVYWPQILEYLGFLLIPVTLFGLLLTKKGSK